MDTEHKTKKGLRKFSCLILWISIGSVGEDYITSACVTMLVNLLLKKKKIQVYVAQNNPINLDHFVCIIELCNSLKKFEKIP